MTSRIVETLYDAAIVFARANVRMPSIDLFTADFLWLASELRIDDPTQPRRVAFSRDLSPLEVANPISTRSEFREVRVGHELTLQTPGGALLVRERSE